MTELKPENSRTLVYKLVEDSNLDESGRIKPESKFSLTYPELRIKDSKFIGNPEDKFETMLFLPEGEGRKGEGGLRTRGYFKFSYKLKDGVWHICDLDGNPVKPAPEDIQDKIVTYLYKLPNKEEINELPLISVITVVLNGERYLEQTIQSVINQTYPNVEYIIIDGGSTDGTLDIIRKYEEQIDYWVSEKDRGLYDAMNKGVMLSIGKYYVVLGSGDFLFDEAISNIFASLKSDAEVYICSVVKDGKEFFYYRPYLFWLGPGYSYPSHSVGSVIKVSLHKVEGLYDMSFKILADSLFMKKIFKSKHRVVPLNIKMGVFNTEGISSAFSIDSLLEAFKMQIHSSSNANKVVQAILLFLRIIKNIRRL